MKDVTGNDVLSLQKEGKKLLVDLWAPWCGPCRSLIPRLEQLDGQYSDIEFIKVNVDENREFAMAHGIRSVPTVIVFNGEEEITKITGAQPDQSYTSVLDSL